jgi:hypothetical protein
MGNVKDRYFKYAESGDQFVGRCLALLPILKIDLAVSPPYFNDCADNEWINSMVKLQFCCLKGIGEFGKMLRMCLASLLYHEEWLNMFLGFNHVVRVSSICHRNADDLKRIKKEEWVVISYPWSHEDKFCFTGVPPYATILQHISKVRMEQKVFCDEFVEKIKLALSEYGVNAGQVSEERVAAIMDNFYQKIDDQISR